MVSGTALYYYGGMQEATKTGTQSKKYGRSFCLLKKIGGH